MRASSRSDRAGFALFWAGGMILFLFVLAMILSSWGSTALRGVGRLSAAQAYHDLCVSALAEAVIALRSTTDRGGALGSLRLDEALGPEYPFDRDARGNALKVAAIPVPLTVKLALSLHGDQVRVAAVEIASGERLSPGEADPLVGTIDLVARVSGNIRGLKGEREVRHTYPFTIPCAVRTRASFTGEYVSVAFGRPKLFTQRMGALAWQR